MKRKIVQIRVAKEWGNKVDSQREKWKHRKYFWSERDENRTFWNLGTKWRQKWYAFLLCPRSYRVALGGCWVNGWVWMNVRAWRSALGDDKAQLAVWASWFQTASELWSKSSNSFLSCLPLSDPLPGLTYQCTLIPTDSSLCSGPKLCLRLTEGFPSPPSPGLVHSGWFLAFLIPCPGWC